MVSDFVSTRFWFKKKLVSQKYRIRYWKKFGIRKKFRIWFCSDFWYHHTLTRRLDDDIADFNHYGVAYDDDMIVDSYR